MAKQYTVSTIDSNNREVFFNPLKLIEKTSREGGEPITSYLRIASVNGDSTSRVIDGIIVNGDVAKVGELYTLISENIEDHYHCIYAAKLSDLHMLIETGFYDSYSRILGSSTSEEVYVSAAPVHNNTSLFDKNGQAMTNTSSSFLMIRTNPKLSGNIKLVVDKDQHLYLDTFKVSNNLNKFAYRHKSVSAASSFATDVRNIFKSLPTEDLYKVPDIDLKAHDPYTSFEDQYDTTYSYGAETNRDEMYSENFKILAPLWVNRVLPDFFVVFRVDSAYNLSTYYNIQDDNEIFNSFLRDGQIVKAFDMRESSPLGKYLHTYYDSISTYPGSVLLQFKEQEMQDDTMSGINSWIGVSVDTGLIVKMDEDSYFANETIKKRSQEKINQFIVGGFERNRLLCPNLINIEFMFNDEEAPSYKMSRYFGLYLKENDFIKYDYVESVISDKTKNYTIKKYDANHEEVEDSIVSSRDSVLENQAYSNRLFFAISSGNVARLKEQSDLTSFLKNEVANMPYKNYQTCNASRIESGYKNFISMKFKQQIRYGEHFRIVVPSLAEEGIQLPIVFEIIASNDKRLKDERDLITPYISVINSENNVTDYIYYREIPERADVDEEVFKKTPTEYPTIQAPSFKYLDKSGPIETKEEVEGLRQSYYYRAVSGQTFKEFSLRHIVKYETKFGMIDNLRGIDSEYYESGDENDIIGTTKYPFIFRLAFYTQDLNDDESLAPLVTQIERLCKCIDTFSNMYSLRVNTISKALDSFSIGTTYNEAYFQHITADILNNDYVDIVSEKIDLGQEVKTKVDDEGNPLYELYDMKYTKPVDEEALTSDTTISYFDNERLGIKMWPLNCQSEQFSGYAMMFAPINFELLGWRKTSIVRMIPVKEYMYELDIEDVVKLIPNTIVNTRSGYERVLDFNVTSMKFTTTSLLADQKEQTVQYYEKLLRDLEEKYNSGEFESEEDEQATYYNYMSLKSWKDDIREVSTKSVFTRSSLDIKKTIVLQSPYHLDKWVIASPYEIPLTFRAVDLYKPSEMSVSLMGIMPVKDFDTEVGVVSKTKVSNSTTIDVPAGERISFDADNDEYSIKKRVFYTIKSGSLKGLPLQQGHSFMVIDDKVYYASRGSISSLETQASSLIAGENGVKLSAPPQHTKVAYSIDKPVMQDDKFYKDDNPREDLAYSLVVPTVCSWRGVGMYYDQDSILSVKGLSVNGTKMSDGYMCKYSPGSVASYKNMFLNNSLDSLVETRDKSLVSFRDYILNTDITDTINIFLSEGISPEYTVGYYNKNINTLEFILYGVKYSITFNTNEYIREIQLSNYNKYEIFIFNHFTGEKNEMIINTLENIILIVDHNFNLKKFDEKWSLLFVDQSTKNLSAGKKYSWISTDKSVDFGDAEFDSDSIWFPTRADASLSSDITASSYYQIDFFDSADFLYFSGKDRFTSLSMPVFNEKYVSISASDKVMSSEGDLETTHSASVFKYNDDPVSSSVAWLINPSYKTVPYAEKGLSEYDKFDLMRDDFLMSLSEDNLVIYVKKKNGTEISITKVETSEDYTPIKMSASYPKNVKYNIDFYNPSFINLVEFDMNESDDLIEKTKTNFILSNTSFKSISRIKNYYGYKIFNGHAHALEEKNGSMFINKEMSLVSSNWDAGFYRSYSSPTRWKGIDGYVVGIEDKTFFGSKGISMRGVEIVIDNWDSNVVKVTSSNTDTFNTEKGDKAIQDSRTFEFNMTQAFYEWYRSGNAPEFISNWSAFANNENAINNYIKLSLIRYFKINTANAFRLYCKPSDGRDILLSLPADFEDFTEVKNFESKYVEVNDEIILIVRVTDTSKTYYATYDLKSNI